MKNEADGDKISTSLRHSVSGKDMHLDGKDPKHQPEILVSFCISSTLSVAEKIESHIHIHSFIHSFIRLDASLFVPNMFFTS